jgi:hypothetical protein
MKLSWRRKKSQRMTFDELYPGAEEGFQPSRSSHLVFKTQTCAPCWMCKRLTTWVEMSFEAPTCSPACDDEAWAMYNRALKKQ